MSDEDDVVTEDDRDAEWDDYLAELSPAEAGRYSDADEEEAAFVAAGESFSQQYQPAPARDLRYLRQRVEACSHAELSELYGEVISAIQAEGLTLDRVEHDGIFRSTGGG